jgi:hypothetical protein
MVRPNIFFFLDYQRDIHDADSDPFVGVKTVRKSIKKVLARNVPDMTASVQQDMRYSQTDLKLKKLKRLQKT